VIGIGYSNVYGRRHAEEYEPLQITGLQFAFGTVWLTAAMLFIDGVPRGIVAETWALIGYLAVVSTVVAFFLLFWLLRHSSAATASLVGYLVPLVAVFAGLAFLDERLQPGILVGGALILAGVVLTEQAPGSPRP
jgi:drug/metabolite transporter (DMT)-like permease